MRPVAGGAVEYAPQNIEAILTAVAAGDMTVETGPQLRPAIVAHASSHSPGARDAAWYLACWLLNRSPISISQRDNIIRRNALSRCT